jgi:hypothetical protein
MKSFPKKLNQHQERGFVLLFAIVVSAVIFFIGAGIFSIAYKELLVSSLGKDSQKSIFAADSAVECALQAYQDGQFDQSSVQSFNCFGGSIKDLDNSTAGRPSFRIFFPDDGSCAKVTVDMITRLDQISFFSQGYNKCNSGNAEPVTAYPGLTERVYRVDLPI